jgi:hypothetical protein
MGRDQVILTEKYMRPKFPPSIIAIILDAGFLVPDYEDAFVELYSLKVI